MKKILLTLLLCLYMTNVNALTYSQYSDFSDYQEEVIKSDELTDVKTERRYKYYKYKKELGPYEKENIENSNYPYIDYDDFKYTEESNYLTTKPSEEKDRIITSHDVYIYKKAKDITYLELKNINYNNAKLILNSISIKYKDKEVKYDVELNNSSNDTINAKGSIKFILNDKLMLNFLTITLDVTSTDTAQMQVISGNDKLSVSTATYRFTDSINRTITWVGADTAVNQNAVELYYTTEKYKNCSAMLIDGQATVYTYKDKLYRKYKLVKDYYSEYLKEAKDDYIYQDSDNYKDYYAKRTRIVLEEPKEELKENNFQIETPKKTKTIEKLLSNNIKPNEKSINTPNMLLKINDDKVINKLSNNYGTYKEPTQNQDKKAINKISQAKNYIPYILLIIILILVLSKLYKNKK